MARRLRLPVYIHPDTRNALPSLGKIDDLREFATGDVLTFRDMEIQTFHTTHDAAAPVGFTITTGEGKIGFVTDLGIATRLVAERLKGCRILVLESNHDEQLLRDGPYPWHLKQRIRGNHGHLSNAASAQLLQDVLWEGLEAVFLAHLSETNNRPELAVTTTCQMLDGQNVCRPQIILGTQQLASACFIT
jgi:phosphoribosyl 1,2-cyclic phosphodiesterase